MSTYNADTDYELIDYFGLFDLANARVVQAQINSIDVGGNSASITLSGECADLAAVGTSEVKFFYHCENSTGTLEDLANGYKAFAVGDFVYCLYMPYVSDDVPERFFIIGHVDKKGTQQCGVGDVLYLMTRESETSGSWYCFFDTVAGTLLNMDTFVNIDDGSPEKPAAIGLYTSAVGAWLDYNFDYFEPLVTVPHTRTLRNLYVSTDKQLGTVLSYTAYTGMTGRITSSNPVDCTAWFNPGNGVYRRVYNTPYTYYSDPSLTLANEIETTNMSNPFGSHASDNEYSCSACWGHTDFSSIKTLSTNSTFPGRCYMRIYDTLSDNNCEFWLEGEEIIDRSNATTLGAGVLYAEATHKVKCSYSFASSDAFIPKPAVSLESECSQQYQLDGWPLWGVNGQPVPQLSEFGADGSIGNVYECKGPLICDDGISPILEGRSGAYLILCASVYYEELLAEGKLFRGYVGSAQNPSGRGNGFKTLYSDTWMTSGEDGEDIVEGMSKRLGRFKVLPLCLISTYSEDFGAGTQVSLAEIRAHSNPVAAAHLRDAIKIMYDKMSDYVASTLPANDPATNVDVWGFYNTQVLLGPTKIALTKKVPGNA